MIETLEELAIRIFQNGILVVGFLLLICQQVLKYVFHETGFFYDKSTVSLGQCYSIIGGELSVLSVSVLAGSFKSGSGVIYSCNEPGLWAIVATIAFMAACAVSIILVLRAFGDTDLTGFLFGVRKYFFIGISIIIGLFSIGFAIHYCG